MNKLWPQFRQAAAQLPGYSGINNAKTGRTGVMLTTNTVGARRPESDRRGARTAESETDIDLERLVYDPAYRQRVRDELNRQKRAPAGDKDV
jgi:hypothetical protein